MQKLLVNSFGFLLLAQNLFKASNKIIMSNIFFERNTISNKIDVQPQKEGFSKLRSKRAQSVSEIKLNPAKFQHREVFDAQIYQKVNFFKCGFKELKDYKKP